MLITLVIVDHPDSPQAGRLAGHANATRSFLSKLLGEAELARQLDEPAIVPKRLLFRTIRPLPAPMKTSLSKHDSGAKSVKLHGKRRLFLP